MALGGRFIDHFGTGDHASRPAAAARPQGSLYACSTHAKIYQTDGAAWSDWASFAGATVAPDVFTSSTPGNGTWTKPASGSPKYHDVYLFGAGAGGGSGRKGAAGSLRMGGTGGGNGGFTFRRFMDSELAATEKYTIGAKGTGGAAQSTNSTNGNAGGGGGATHFGNSVDGVAGDAKCHAHGGSAGVGGDNATDPNQGGTPGYGNVQSRVQAQYDSGITTVSNFFEGGGGSRSFATALTGAFSYAAGGGGGGGALDTANNERAGGAGGRPADKVGWANANGGAVHASGSAGATILGETGPHGGFGGGGGGSSKTGGSNGGTGGAGTGPGAGGGGGGAGLDSSTNSGAGGDGADGAIWVITYYA